MFLCVCVGVCVRVCMCMFVLLVQHKDSKYNKHAHMRTHADTVYTHAFLVVHNAYYCVVLERSSRVRG